MAPGMALVYLILCLRTWSFPDPSALAFSVAAIVIAASAPLFVQLDARPAQEAWKRYVNMAFAVGFPMLFFGAGLTRWAVHTAGFPWPALIASLVVMTFAASALLNSLVASIMTANIAMWLGVWSVIREPIALVAIAASLALGSALTLRHNRLRKREAQLLFEQERVQNRALDLLADYENAGHGWFWETDRRGILTYVSPPIGAMLGVAAVELVGRPLTSLFILGNDSHEGERTLNFHLTARSPFTDLGVRAAVRSEERWWSISGRPVYDNFNNFVGFRGSGSDLTEKRRTQEHATRLARYDALTGLANRFQMSETLEKILNAPREDDRVCSVFLLDLDRFKHVNDTMGHPTGDALLKQVAQRLEQTVGAAGRVGRLGGDEFQVVLPGAIPRDDLASLADAIIENLSQTYLIDGFRVVIGASIGVACAPVDGVTSEALIRNADLALYAAKDGGRGRHYFYDPDLHSEAEERRRLEHDLRDAIINGGLELDYQPVVQTTTEKITGFEALLRWNHPILGYISPTKFIPVAEEAGLIAQIGEWALRTACQELARWPQSVRVAVNVSSLQFANPALPAIVTNALSTAQVDPSRLELEITESVFMNDDASTKAMFTALKRVGVRLALDDFGTGYSSLGYLKKAPFDKIKIDQSFVRGAALADSRNGAIIASIVSLAEALGMETTAEGVETLDELDLIRMLGCSHVQGFIYEKPLDSDNAMKRLERGLEATACGPRSARPTRQRMFRKVLLDHNGEKYNATIRNISATGVMVEGLWNVPPGTEFEIHMSEGHVVSATARWSKDDRVGVEFAVPLETDSHGQISFRKPRTQRRDESSPALLRRTG